jgi:hypothetical protein
VKEPSLKPVLTRACSADVQDAASLRALFSAADSAGVPRYPASRHELNLLTMDRPHQVKEST